MPNRHLNLSKYNTLLNESGRLADALGKSACKGSPGSVGAVVVAGLCAQIEAIGRSGSAVGTEEILVQLEPEIARATSELAKLRRP